MPTANTATATTPTCLGCDYPLIALTTNRCPECGREFDLTKRDTFGPRRLRDSPFHPVIAGILVQFGVFVLSGLFLCACGDDPTPGIVFSAIIANWISTAIVVVRRRRRVTSSDLLIIKYSAIYYLAPAFFFAMTIPGWLRPLVPLAWRFW